MRNLKKGLSRTVDPQGKVDRKSREFRERGAASVFLVLMIPVLFGALAVALDFGKLVYQQQQLSNAMDASALAAVHELPNPVAAETTAKKFATLNDPQAAPVVTFWCIVASSGAGRTVATGQIPGVCDPGTTAGARCTETICAIPCPKTSDRKCNSVTVTDDKDVPFDFAPVIGINSGNTGAQSATACNGSCGALSPNPMDVALVADRTGSMTDTNRDKMIAGIKKTLQTMTKEQQYVALGTIHRSKSAPGTCITEPSGNNTGPWIPVPFSNNYTLNPATPGATPPLNTTSTLYQGLDCLNSSSGGTYLAAPMKAAARYVLGEDANNLGSLPVRPTSTPAKKAIIFETDGQPNEANIAGSRLIKTAGDIGSSNGNTACDNLTAVAGNAKDLDVLIVTVAFGDAGTKNCDGSNGNGVARALAASASKDASGNVSQANYDCATLNGRIAENRDGDFFFCAADGDELGPIFTAAINAISPNSHLIRIPD
ncbi:MAG: pilus assembly protein TadG-related protein [Specibacter sp.]